MEGCKPATTHISTFLYLANTDGQLLNNPTLCRSVVGGLQYLTWTRPGISLVVNKVCQFTAIPTTTHLSAVKKILKYIKDTINYGIYITRTNLLIQAFIDTDWAGNV